MKISRTNSNGSLFRDRVAKVVSDARPGVTYGARCVMSLRGGKITRVWSIFTAGIKRPRAKVKS